ncbi:hypothetical protein DIS24_g11203 [Lasiodiplodia hormozganensis]|uniref:Uncharacterized protein n=1 Tax=Lasiodiplodia hormozganensis TaxID=869390 RepID=A0AA40C4H7_9PEZI|nr:hypothetical protein DIS24_g11203 [Lasiodiplodia hormozganensis]
MGAHHSVEVDGTTTGWLASSPFAGCCASGSRADEEVDPFQINHGNGRRRSITDEQPRSLRPLMLESARPLPRPSTGQAMRQWVGNRQVESRTPGYPYLSMRSAKAKNSSRPLISAPTDFRHIDGSGTHPPMTMAAPVSRQVQADTQPGPTLRRKPSFRPLQLSIYMPEQQLSPLPDFMRNSWDKQPSALPFPGQAHVRNRTDSMCSEPAFMVPRKPIPSYVDGSFGDYDDARTIDIPLRAVKRSSTMPIPDRPKTINADLCSYERNTDSPLPISGPSSPRMRSNTEPISSSRSLRKRPSYRTPRDSVEDAISELNSIVEEQRAKKLASNSPKQHHVPALAPNFKMHVRSETLSDIGSALSVPFTTKPLPSIPPSPVVDNEDSPAMPSLTNSQTDLLIRFPTPPASTSASRINTPKSRLATFMQRRRNNASVDTLRTYTSSKLTHSRTATDDTLNSFASSVTATSASDFYHAPAIAALQSDTSSRPYASPSLASTTATCPTNSTLSLPDTISTVRDVLYQDEDDDDDSDARSSTPDTTVSAATSPVPERVNTRNLSVPSFGIALEMRERQGKSWSAVVEGLDDKKIESGEGIPKPPQYVDLDYEEARRGRTRQSGVGIAF